MQGHDMPCPYTQAAARLQESAPVDFGQETRARGGVWRSEVRRRRRTRGGSRRR